MAVEALAQFFCLNDETGLKKLFRQSSAAHLGEPAILGVDDKAASPCCQSLCLWPLLAGNRIGQPSRFAPQHPLCLHLPMLATQLGDGKNEPRSASCS
jgi:hypothetical protein